MGQAKRSGRKRTGPLGCVRTLLTISCTRSSLACSPFPLWGKQVVNWKVLLLSYHVSLSLHANIFLLFFPRSAVCNFIPCCCYDLNFNLFSASSFISCPPQRFWFVIFFILLVRIPSWWFIWDFNDEWIMVEHCNITSWSLVWCQNSNWVENECCSSLSLLCVVWALW